MNEPGPCLDDFLFALNGVPVTGIFLEKFQLVFLGKEKMCIKYHGLSMLYFVAAAVNGYNFKRAFIFNYLSDTLLNIDYKKRKKVDKPTKWYDNQLYGTFFFKMKFIVLD